MSRPSTKRQHDRICELVSRYIAVRRNVPLDCQFLLDSSTARIRVPRSKLNGLNRTQARAVIHLLKSGL